MPLRYRLALRRLTPVLATLAMTLPGPVEAATSDSANPAPWPQFRGPGGLGVAPDTAHPPVEFGPTQRVQWSVACPSGNSSPITWGTKLFLTARQDNALLTLAYDAATGRELWRREVAPPKVEEVHPSLGSPATATPVTDGERVYVYFGSTGLRAYDMDGQPAWERPLPFPQTEYGASSSPVIAGENVIQLVDQDGGSFLVAVNRRSGEIAWKADRPEMRRGFGTPLVWSHHNRMDLVVPGTIWLEGRDPATGEERWRVSGLARITCTSPVVGDGVMFTASWTTGGDRNSDRITMPDWDAFVAQNDANKDGRFEFSELPPGPVRQRFKHLDGNRDSFITHEEWTSMAEIFARVENQAFAVKPDAQGGLSDGGVLWRFKKGLPYVASPIYYRGRFYLVKNGGMLTCLDPKSGAPMYQEERLGAVGDYYASLVAADGRLYLASQPGVITVVQAGDTFQVLARNDLREVIQASPAVRGNTLYVRTAGNLYAFGEGGAPTKKQ